MIRELRKKLGIKQYELAKRVGISQSFLCHIEKGRRTPSLDVATRIAKALGVKVDEIAESVVKKCQ